MCPSSAPATAFIVESGIRVSTENHIAGFIYNESRGRSIARSHLFLSEDEPIPEWNGPVLTIAQIMKFFMALASEAKLGAMIITEQAMVSQRNNMEEMGWKQPRSPI